MHRHHLLPKRLGGTDDEENLTPPISIELHAEFHKDLWLHYGDQRDYIAWKALSGRITGEEARLAAAKVGQRFSKKYKDAIYKNGKNLAKLATKETCSAGGKKAIGKLLKWQKNNKELFLKQSAMLGKLNAVKRCIPHLYMGVVYESKKELQKVHNMWNITFYKKLKSGEITRLDRLVKENEQEVSM